ncbi:MAG: hypothetical protein J6F30_11210 [Cellulosilyticum sp.]|nr:hypothetical protein [Cellulosilyticum sp.]
MKYQSTLIWLIRGIFFVFSVFEMIRLNWADVALLIAGFVLSFIPYLYEKWVGIKIPLGACLILDIFLLGTQFFGSYLGAYTYFSWWDIMLHLSSGILVGYIGLILLITLDRNHLLFIKKKIGVIILFVFAIAVTGAVFWEIFEFTSDTLFGTNTQLGSLRDTMGDLICGTIVGGVFALYIGMMLHEEKKSCVSKLLQLNSSKAKRKK